MENHQPYSEIFGRQYDFRVKYELLPSDNPTGYQFLPADGEPRKLVYQGARFDFRYVDDAKIEREGFIIWPEFEDRAGFLILGKWIPIEPSGTARMWIVNRNFLEFHNRQLKIGALGYMIQGDTDVAKCEVVGVNIPI